MSAFFEGRTSDSPYIEVIWRGHVTEDYFPLCPADAHWNFLFTRQGNRIRVSAEGAVTGSVLKSQTEGVEFLVIKFKLGTFMPWLPAAELLNGDTTLEQAAGRSFCLNGMAWELPNFNNVEAFVERLVREDILVTDPVVKAVVDDENQPQWMSDRTIRRRFLRATGLTPLEIQQIERAKLAGSLLESGVSILDVVAQTGYADQPHLTRAIRRFYGTTPAQLLREPRTATIATGA